MYTFSAWRCYVDVTRKIMDIFNDIEIARLLCKKMLGELSPDETKRLNTWAEATPENKALLADFLSGKSWRKRKQLLHANDTDETVRRVWQKIRRRKRTRLWTWGSVAAATVAILAGIGLYLTNIPTTQKTSHTPEYAQTGNNTVVLEMASGERIAVDNRDSLTQVRLQANGASNKEEHLVYTDTTKITEVQEHKLYVPQGGEYTLTLADGTTIHLNADTRVRYPNRFIGSERRVWLEGEAYFDVATDSTRPFIVETPGMETRVLGTEFNIYAYAGERERTTLVEGRVEVSADGERVLLSPGEQAERMDGKLITRDVDVAACTAWTRQQFDFDNTPLEDMLRQLSRWYGFKVFVENPSLRTKRFTATFPRYEQAGKVLLKLEMTTHIRFELNNGLLVVKEE